MHWAIAQGWFGVVDPKADPHQLAFACFGYFIFSLFIMVASFEVNKVFAIILILINVLLPSLGFSIDVYKRQDCRRSRQSASEWPERKKTRWPLCVTNQKADHQ